MKKASKKHNYSLYKLIVFCACAFILGTGYGLYINKPLSECLYTKKDLLNAKEDALIFQMYCELAAQKLKKLDGHVTSSSNYTRCYIDGKNFTIEELGVLWKLEELKRGKLK